MNKDRGNIKWTSLMLPEHVRELKRSLMDERKVSKPILDEQQIEILEEIIVEAIDRDLSLAFSIFENGFINTVIGNVTFIDHIQKQFKIKDTIGDIHKISFDDVTNIEKSEYS